MSGSPLHSTLCIFFHCISVQYVTASLVYSIFTCLDRWGSTHCHTVDLEELSWPAAPDNIKSKSSGSLGQVCVHRETPELGGLVREPWESRKQRRRQKYKKRDREMSGNKYLGGKVLQVSKSAMVEILWKEQFLLCVYTTKWLEVTCFRSGGKKAEKRASQNNANQSPDGF